ncbi:hypothetical protein NDU88_008385 [Pleurodeles waltl]|uniref:Uncharacterized protein n=1 Tax=Pleurodeles waltl TaxID=8319 RepID=A0AAV7QRM2_PLEWA|nr:hypothetical protein NDU88_008385 [Pleurodeles waltl]
MSVPRSGRMTSKKAAWHVLPPSTRQPGNQRDTARPTKRARKVKFKGARRVPSPEAPAAKEILRILRSGRVTSKKGAWHIPPPSTRQPGNQRDPARPAKWARKVTFKGARRVPPPQAPAAKEILRRFI